MRVFITGISSGVGQALVKELIKAGHEVWGVARRQEFLDRLTHDLATERLVAIAGDITSESFVAGIISKMNQQHWFPEVVILNAAVYLHDCLDDLSFQRFQTGMKTNVDGALVWVYAFLPAYLKQNKGLFIAISSTAAYRPSWNSISYAASKSALSMAFRSFRFHYKKSDIRFTTVHLGPINTTMWDGKQSWLIPNAKKTASFVIKLISKKSGSCYYPFITTTLFRLSILIPDRTFSILRSIFLK